MADSNWGKYSFWQRFRIFYFGEASSMQIARPNIARGNSAEFQMGNRLTRCPQKGLVSVFNSKPPAARMRVQVIEIKGIANQGMPIDKPAGSRRVGMLQGGERDSILELLSGLSSSICNA
jgi:hypothetical protein